MKETFVKIRKKDKGFKPIKMVANTLDNLEIIKDMVKEFCINITEMNMKENGEMINLMDKEFTKAIMEIFIKAIGSMVKKKEKESNNG